MAKAKAEAKESPKGSKGETSFETVETNPKDHSKDANLHAALAYFFGILGGLIILFAVEKEDKWVRFCAAQSIILGVIMLALYVVIIGFILSPLWFLLYLYLAFLAYNYKTIRIPKVCEYADKLAEPK